MKVIKMDQIMLEKSKDAEKSDNKANNLPKGKRLLLSELDKPLENEIIVPTSENTKKELLSH